MPGSRRSRRSDPDLIRSRWAACFRADAGTAFQGEIGDGMALRCCGRLHHNCCWVGMSHHPGRRKVEYITLRLDTHVPVAHCAQCEQLRGDRCPVVHSEDVLLAKHWCDSGQLPHVRGTSRRYPPLSTSQPSDHANPLTLSKHASHGGPRPGQRLLQGTDGDGPLCTHLIDQLPEPNINRHSRHLSLPFPSSLTLRCGQSAPPEDSRLP